LWGCVAQKIRRRRGLKGTSVGHEKNVTKLQSRQKAVAQFAKRKGEGSRWKGGDRVPRACRCTVSKGGVAWSCAKSQGNDCEVTG